MIYGKTTFSDRALARTLGTSDPKTLSLVGKYLADPDGHSGDAYIIRYTGSLDDEEATEIATVEDEIERLIQKYDHHGNMRRDH